MGVLGGGWAGLGGAGEARAAIRARRKQLNPRKKLRCRA